MGINTNGVDAYTHITKLASIEKNVTNALPTVFPIT
jgi:hypothetical protein